MTDFTPYVADHRADDRRHVVIVYARSAKLHVLAMIDGIVCQDLPLDAERHMTPMFDKKLMPYPLRKALRTFKRVAKSHGVTSRGKRILKQLESAS